MIRLNAPETIRRLHLLEIEKSVMLTGDNPRTAAAVANQVGIDDYYADLRPEDTSATVAALRATYGHVGMVGDGANDAPPWLLPAWGSPWAQPAVTSPSKPPMSC